MEFKLYPKIGSGTVELREDRKGEVKSLTSTQKFFSGNGMWSFPRINSRASVVCSVYKWSYRENKFSVKNNIICWRYLCHNLKHNFWRFLFNIKFSSVCLMINWLAANNLIKNLGKINIMKFITKNHILRYVLVIRKSM